jgi:hypothetical protein
MLDGNKDNLKLEAMRRIIGVRPTKKNNNLQSFFYII